MMYQLSPRHTHARATWRLGSMISASLLHLFSRGQRRLHTVVTELSSQVGIAFCLLDKQLHLRMGETPIFHQI